VQIPRRDWQCRCRAHDQQAADSDRREFIDKAHTSELWTTREIGSPLRSGRHNVLWSIDNLPIRGRRAA
jgi:hypothetical protein